MDRDEVQTRKASEDENLIEGKLGALLETDLGLGLGLGKPLSRGGEDRGRKEGKEGGSRNSWHFPEARSIHPSR